jgi:hypothetical protein
MAGSEYDEVAGSLSAEENADLIEQPQMLAPFVAQHG